ncbi:PDZ domain-containing protein [Chitinophaga rhizophila]|uniref:PDZ domain-containing protein n=1 Tax=Chitinophaga rhizophila TaxID=2866212 RepID=A0ABS7GEX0_9BACT|nr:PDZ domain-containing protein [Chitinophaga rhizophila]MBW8685815.1 PDZ domain-containing protein [Chitinophaga rhizophila]
MSKLLQTFTLASITCFAFSSATMAQDKNAGKSDKLGEYDEIVIKRNSNKDGKVTIEIKDGHVLVDGEKMDAYKDGDISVYRRRIRPVDGNTFNFAMPRGGGGMQFFNDDDEDADSGAPIIRPGKAVLGVFTEKKEAAGVTVKEVATGSPAEKAGIKAGDVITGVDADKIAEPRELFEKIGVHDPGDKVTITYLRDKKETKVTVTLDERKGEGTLELFPRGREFRRAPRGSFNFGDGAPGFRREFPGFSESNEVKLGLSVQDTEDGKGAQVLSVAPGSAAEKAGFKADDIITDIAGTTVSSTRDVASAYRANKDKGTFSAKVKRGSQQKTLEIKVPKKLHKVDL